MACRTSGDNHSRESTAAFPALDVVTFQELRETFDALTLAATYRELLTQTRQRLLMVAADVSARNLRHTGHTLRGTAAMFGASAIALLATELEYAAETPERVADLLKRLEAACDELETALTDRQVSL